MPRKKAKSKQPPSQLVDDGDGHWYLVPESEIVAFEQAAALIAEANRFDSNLSDRAYDAACETWARFERMSVDGPHRLRILAWEEMN